MNFLRCILFIAVFILSTKTLAYSPKEGNVTATFGPFVYRTDFKGTGHAAEAPARGTFALIGDGDISDKGSLEVAFIHMIKNFLRDEGGKYISEEEELVHISMGYRRWFTPRFSAALTFYSSYANGQPKTIYSEFPAGQEIDTSARDITEYGFDLSLQRELWAKDRWATTIEARYSIPVTNKKDEKADLFGVMFGVRYFIQEKQIVSGPHR